MPKRLAGLWGRVRRQRPHMGKQYSLNPLIEDSKRNDFMASMAMTEKLEKVRLQNLA
jgi:hypothetical protein